MIHYDLSYLHSHRCAEHFVYSVHLLMLPWCAQPSVALMSGASPRLRLKSLEYFNRVGAHASSGVLAIEHTGTNPGVLPHQWAG